jgi:hypothetical protein
MATYHAAKAARHGDVATQQVLTFERYLDRQPPDPLSPTLGSGGRLRAHGAHRQTR